MATPEVGSDGHMNLREHKEAGAAVRDLAASGALDKCTSLDLEYGGGVGDATLALVGDHGGQLRSLNLNACQDYTDEGLLSIARGCTSLTNLSLYWNVKITDESVPQAPVAPAGPGRARKCRRIASCASRLSP